MDLFEIGNLLQSFGNLAKSDIREHLSIQASLLSVQHCPRILSMYEIQGYSLASIRDMPEEVEVN